MDSAGAHVVDTQRVVLFLPSSQGNHRWRYVDADDTSGARLPDQPRIKPFSASQIDDVTLPKISHQFEMIGNFGIDSKWQRLRALIGSN